MAALPPTTLIDIEGTKGLRLTFEGASTQLNAKNKEQLEGFARTVSVEANRIQLKAYGGGSSETASTARRLSLSRALAVRSFLIEQGVRSTRIDVRALGIAGDSGPAERVDVLLLNR